MFDDGDDEFECEECGEEECVSELCEIKKYDPVVVGGGGNFVAFWREPDGFVGSMVSVTNLVSEVRSRQMVDTAVRLFREREGKK